MPFILAIDQSTSATKAILYDTSLTAIDSESLEHRQIYPQPGWVEHDADEIWRNTVTVIKTLLTRHPEAAAPGGLICLSITNQRETVVVFDKKTGVPLHNALVWQCRRGDAICAGLRDAGYEDQVREITGLRLDTYFSASKLRWLIENNAAVRQGIENGTALAGTIDAYLVYRLTGGASFVTDHTNACRTLLYDVRRLAWDKTLCSMFKVPMHALPCVKESCCRMGETDIEGVLGRPVPICGVMGDSQASLFAHCCFDEGRMKVTFGTGSSVLLNTGMSIHAGGRGSVATLAWVLNGKPAYCAEGIISFSAATIAWLKDQVQMITSAGETEALARSVPDNGGVYLVPAFAGLSAPYWRPDARAAIVGLTAHSTRAHIVRAALESIAFQIRDVAAAMVQEGVALTYICADGGPTVNSFLMQFTADLTGCDVVVAREKNLSPRGAAMCAGLGMGIFKDLAALESVRSKTETYRPSMPPERVKTLYDGWKSAVGLIAR